MEFHKLFKEAEKIIDTIKLSGNNLDNYENTSVTVLLTEKQNIYTGLNGTKSENGSTVETSSGYEAITSMMKHNETRVKEIMTLFFNDKKIIMLPLDAVSLLFQINKENQSCLILTGPNQTVELKSLLTADQLSEKPKPKSIFDDKKTNAPQQNKPKDISFFQENISGFSDVANNNPVNSPENNFNQPQYNNPNYNQYGQVNTQPNYNQYNQPNNNVPYNPNLAQQQYNQNFNNNNPYNQTNNNTQQNQPPVNNHPYQNQQNYYNNQQNPNNPVYTQPQNNIPYNQNQQPQNYQNTYNNTNIANNPYQNPQSNYNNNSNLNPPNNLYSNPNSYPTQANPTPVSNKNSIYNNISYASNVNPVPTSNINNQNSIYSQNYPSQATPIPPSTINNQNSVYSQNYPNKVNSIPSSHLNSSYSQNYSSQLNNSAEDSSSLYKKRLNDLLGGSEPATENVQNTSSQFNTEPATQFPSMSKEDLMRSAKEKKKLAKIDAKFAKRAKKKGYL